MEMGENWGLLKAERGYVYPGYFAKLIPHLKGGREEQLKVLVHFDEEDSALLREGIASELFRRHGGSEESLEADYIAARRTVEAVEPGKAAVTAGACAIMMESRRSRTIGMLFPAGSLRVPQ